MQCDSVARGTNYCLYEEHRQMQVTGRDQYIAGSPCSFSSLPVCVYKFSSYYLKDIIFMDNNLGPLAIESPCILLKYNQQDEPVISEYLFYLFLSTTCFGRILRPSSGARNCVYSNGICKTAAATCKYQQFWAPDDKRKDRQKHVERFIRINNLR
jgi:hypothetical protein